MKKVFLIITLLFLLTGCEAVANINIDNDKISEKIAVKADSEKEYNNIKQWEGFPLTKYYDEELQNPFASKREKESGVSYYDEVAYDNEKTIRVESDFTFESHLRSSVVKNCFRYYNITEDENDSNLKTFATSEGLICDFSNFEVKIRTPYIVTQNNADSIDKINNIYSWKINNSEKTTALISLTIDFSKKYNETNSDSENDSNKKTEDNVEEDSATVNNTGDNKIYPYIIIVILILIVVALAIVLKIKKDKVSKV